MGNLIRSNVKIGSFYLSFIVLQRLSTEIFPTTNMWSIINAKEISKNSFLNDVTRRYFPKVWLIIIVRSLSRMRWNFCITICTDRSILSNIPLYNDEFYPVATRCFECSRRRSWDEKETEKTEREREREAWRLIVAARVNATFVQGRVSELGKGWMDDGDGSGCMEEIETGYRDGRYPPTDSQGWKSSTGFSDCLFAFLSCSHTPNRLRC